MKRDGKDTNYFLNGQHKSYFFLFNFSSVCVCFGKNYVSLQAGMKYLFTLISLMATLMAVACSDGKGCRCEAEGLMQVPAEGYVMLEDGHFTVDGEVWFPKMMNYKAGMREVDGRLEVVPADFYTGHSVASISTPSPRGASTRCASASMPSNPARIPPPCLPPCAAW